MNQSPFVVIVSFTTTAENQARALEQIHHYIDTFLSQQPGFISARLHKALDGHSIVNYAQWETGEDFKRFSELARSHPELPGLLQFQPKPRFFEVAHCYEGEQGQ